MKFFKLLLMTCVASGSLFAMEGEHHGQKRTSQEVERIEVKKQKVCELTADEINVFKAKLLVAACEGYVDQASIILKVGISVDTVDEQGYSMLTYGILHEHAAIVDLALQHNADVTLQTVFGEAALHMAAADVKPAILMKLLAKGADSNMPGNHQFTPLHYVLDNHAAPIENRYTMYRALVDYGADEQALDVSYQQKISVLVDHFRGRGGSC